MGFAQKLFKKRTGTSVGARARTLLTSVEHMDALIDSGIVDAFDGAIVDTILSGSSRDEMNNAFVAYLSMAARCGHLCVRWSENTFLPSPSSLVRQKNEHDADLEQQIIEFVAQVESGHSSLKEGICAGPSDDCSAPIVRCCRRNGDVDYYLRRYWKLERTLLDRLEALSRETPSVAVDVEFVVNEEKFQKSFLPEQAQAVVSALRRGLTVVTGGPGTGKSYTAASFLRWFRQALVVKNRTTPVQVALAAPTGKAAANLQNALGAVTVDANVEVERAKTLHSLLGIRRDGTRARNAPQLEADVIIVDECSMVDATMMLHLLTAVKSGARLVLLGDSDQLPPVEVGSLFADFVDMLERRHEAENLVRLRTCVRAELQGILHVGSAVNSGDANGLIRLLEEDSEGISWMEAGDEEAAAQVVKRAVVEYRAIEGDDPSQRHLAYSRYRVLSPMRRGPLGAEALNAAIGEQLYKEAVEVGATTFIAPVMATANDHRLHIHNGEGGLLIKKVAGRWDGLVIAADDELLFLCHENEGEWRRFPAAVLPRTELAYCMSVHKSQGSEFRHVVLLVPEGAAVFGREVIYTGVTRAKRQLDIVSSKQALINTLARSSRRLSGLGRSLAK
ncbi:Uncharacterized protein SCG7086_AX_00090 [Chlamydiales bacterium SCGC AG-110-P3]|nr:Uncharacterized protein SCG7086_AX_00090 [Chlamydiales bacterium SCGC AG-110-P3]